MTHQPLLNAEQPSLYIPGLVLLAVILITCIMPLTLSFLPQTAGLLGCIYFWIKNKTINAPRWTYSYLPFLAIPILTIASSLWSITPDTSLSRSIKISMEVFSFFPLLLFMQQIPDNGFRFIKSNFWIPLAIGAAFLFIELTFDFPLSRVARPAHTEFSTWELNKNVSELVLLTPFALIFSLQEKKWKPAILLGILVLGVLMVTASQAAQLATIAILIAAAGLYILPTLALPLCFGTCILLFLSMPWLSGILYESLASQAGESHILRDASTSPRLEVWDFISDKIKESPWIGFGVDTTRSMKFDYPMVYYWDTTILHPHNVALQLWIEFGVIGALLGGSVLGLIYSFINRLSRYERFLPTLIFTGTIVFLLASWSVWSSWLMGLIVLMLALCHRNSIREI
ncbi:MAG: O-antigen ligase family protein [Pseudobdellovibrionaceae bacterium]